MLYGPTTTETDRKEATKNGRDTGRARAGKVGGVLWCEPCCRSVGGVNGVCRRAIGVKEG